MQYLYRAGFLNPLMVAAGLMIVTNTSLAQTDLKPNWYQFRSTTGTWFVSYARSSLLGQPQVTITRNDNTQHFSGDQVRTRNTELGKLLTVTLRSIPDLKTVTATVIIPSVNVADGPEPVKTQLIVTTHHTSFAGPVFVDGQTQTYRTRKLEGMASRVEFLHTGIGGLVIQSPTCPGPITPDVDYQSPLVGAVLDILDTHGNRITGSETDGNGLFFAKVPPGTYTVSVNNGDSLFPTCREQAVEALEGAGAFLHICCDTCIR